MIWCWLEDYWISRSGCRNEGVAWQSTEEGYTWEEASSSKRYVYIHLYSGFSSGRVVESGEDNIYCTYHLQGQKMCMRLMSYQGCATAGKVLKTFRVMCSCFLMWITVCSCGDLVGTQKEEDMMFRIPIRSVAEPSAPSCGCRTLRKRKNQARLQLEVSTVFTCWFLSYL